ncbi:MAG: hypothetical protein WKF80_02095 [Thermomicrobiales bacterium]
MVAFLVMLGLAGAWLVAGRRDAEDFGQRQPGQRVYDLAGALGPSEIRLLERHAADLERGGVPVVVYIRAGDADPGATRTDALDLMRAWHIETTPGADDGLVVFMNVAVGESFADAIAIVPGNRLKDQGALPSHELERIMRRDVMVRVRGERVTAGLSAGLSAAARSLRLGPQAEPTPGPVQRTAATFSGVPVLVLTSLATLACAALAIVSARARAAGEPMPTSTVPGSARDASPALAGLVMRGRPGAHLVEATLVDLVVRGVITWRGDGAAGIFDLRRDAGPVHHDPGETVVRTTLARVAGPTGTIQPDVFSAMSAGGMRAATLRALRAWAAGAGWWDATAARRASLLHRLAGVFVAGGAVTAALAIVGDAPAGLVAAGLLVLAALMLFWTAARSPGLTPTGRAVRDRWAVGPPFSATVETDVPYLIALGRCRPGRHPEVSGLDDDAWRAIHRAARPRPWRPAGRRSAPRPGLTPLAGR